MMTIIPKKILNLQPTNKMYLSMNISYGFLFFLINFRNMKNDVSSMTMTKEKNSFSKVKKSQKKCFTYIQLWQKPTFLNNLNNMIPKREEKVCYSRFFLYKIIIFI